MKQARSLVVIVSSVEASVGECNDCIRQSHTHIMRLSLSTDPTQNLLTDINSPAVTEFAAVWVNAHSVHCCMHPPWYICCVVSQYPSHGVLDRAYLHNDFYWLTVDFLPMKIIWASHLNRTVVPHHVSALGTLQLLSNHMEKNSIISHPHRHLGESDALRPQLPIRNNRMSISCSLWFGACVLKVHSTQN